MKCFYNTKVAGAGKFFHLYGITEKINRPDIGVMNLYASYSALTMLKNIYCHVNFFCLQQHNSWCMDCRTTEEPKQLMQKKLNDF